MNTYMYVVDKNKTKDLFTTVKRESQTLFRQRIKTFDVYLENLDR